MNSVVRDNRDMQLRLQHEFSEKRKMEDLEGAIELEVRHIEDFADEIEKLGFSELACSLHHRALSGEVSQELLRKMRELTREAKAEYQRNLNN